MKKLIAILLSTALLTSAALAKDKDKKDDDPAAIYAGIEFRAIGPAVTSGRITDFAMIPGSPHKFYAATASGGLWYTANNGQVWTPVFDSYGSYSIGDVEVDPNDAAVIWVGTGENNSQRSVGYGDGVYKSIDGGKSFKNVGLKDSQHIGKIIIDPRDSNIVYVAAQGPLWNEGGDRGLYKTTDGGETWQKILEIDEHTGVNEVIQNPDQPELMLATSYQRRRHVWVLIDGGPGSAVHRSDDGGASWSKITDGLPDGDLGRIGLGMAPSDPNIVYAVVETADGGGIYRSDDFGKTWSKQSDRGTSSPQYYNELVVDPGNPDRVYLMDTFLSVSEDAGKTWAALSTEAKHVDEHALWIDPRDTDHLITGSDGGIYESFDQGAHWRHYRNLPITQFYRVEADNDFPFYNVYGGTQDNQSLGVPSRNTTVGGIVNADWTYTLYGDGFQTRVDPENPNIIYSQLQYGLLFRYDKKNGDRVWITPQPDQGEDTYRWNWNSALIISPHNSKRLYFGAEYLFRSDDMGNSWRKVSGDLTRDLDRNKLEVMGRVWSVDAVAKNDSTSIYGSIISLSESPLQENLIYAGTDDGLIQITEDGGESWTRVERVRGVPEMSYVGDLVASSHDVNVVFATFDNHKKGDFKPYLYRSDDKGRKWTSIAGNLPERGTVHTIQQDHVDPNLLFAGTEFGVFFSQNGGQTWTQLKGNIPTIAVRDLEIQQRENDLVLATFGRGFYILDDYSPLRADAATVKDSEAFVFEIKDPWLYVENDRFLGGAQGSFCDDFYSADNPPYGAVITYYLKDGLKTKKELRQEAEQEVKKEGGDNFYPSWDELREEDWEEAPALVFTISDWEGNVVRRITGPSSAGLHRIAWDLRTFDVTPVSLDGEHGDEDEDGGHYVLPGAYTVAMAKRHGGQWSELSEPAGFTVKALLQGSFESDLEGLHAFMTNYSELMRQAFGAGKYMAEIRTRIDHIKQALMDDPEAGQAVGTRIRELDRDLKELDVLMNGDQAIISRNEQAPASIRDRLFGTYGLLPFVLSASLENPTDEARDSIASARTEFDALVIRLEALNKALEVIEEELAGSAPWTPGRGPKTE